MISIITVSYNAVDTIQKTFDSVRKSKNKDIEYIVIDGKSTDGTCEIIEKNRDIVEIYISENDCGIYDAINKGIKYSKGEYTLFLAADDLLIPGAIEKFLQSVKSGTDVWVGSIILHNEFGYFIEESDKDLDRLKRECSLRHPAAFFKKETFEKFGYYDSSLKCSGDRELFLRFYLQGAKFQIENIPIEIFNIGGISTAGSFSLLEREGIIIEKRYGVYRSTASKQFKSRVKRLIKDSFIGRCLLHLYYSDSCYYVISSVFNSSFKKLNQKIINEMIG